MKRLRVTNWLIVLTSFSVALILHFWGFSGFYSGAFTGLPLSIVVAECYHMVTGKDFPGYWLVPKIKKP